MNDIPTTQSRSNNRLHLYWLVGLLAVVGLFIYVVALPKEAQAPLLQENGLIENASVVGYLICIALFFSLLPFNRAVNLIYIPILLLLLACRELDFDKAYFTDGLLRSSQYLGSRTDLVEKLYSFVILSIILSVVFIFLRNHTKNFFPNLRSGDPVAICIMLAGFFMVSSKLLDGIQRKVRPLGIELSETTKNYAFIYEETAELGIPVLFAMALLCFAAGKRGENT